MLRWIQDLDERAHARIEAAMRRRGILYPWWIPTTSFAGQVVCVTLALLQRDALWPLDPLAVTLALVLLSPGTHFLLGRWVPWWLDSLGPLAAAGLLMLDPVGSGIDLAPALLALATAEIVARDGVLPGSIVGLASAGIITATQLAVGLDSYGVYLLEVLLGGLVGAMLWWQMRALTAERQARAGAWEQATTAERERIAREIHDLVAHSLSVSLLQVTGARHALRDVRDAPDANERSEAVDEVDAALADAEQVGRRALADIRRTVSTMARGETGGSDRHSLPGAGDIAALVQEMADAGLAIEYDEQGDPGALPAATGLGLYRIAQESLSNVARHGGAGARARVRFTVTGSGAHLQVSNPLPSGRPRPDGLGSGLAGMQARASQLGATLRAGPVGSTWLVDVRLGQDPRAGRLTLPCGTTFGQAPGPEVAR